MKYAQVADVWLTKKTYDNAEIVYFENIAKKLKASLTPLAQEVAKARQKLCESLDSFSSEVHSISPNNAEEFKALEARVTEVEKAVRLIFDHLKSLSERLTSSEKQNASARSVREIDLKKQPQIQESAKNDDDDDLDLFTSDSDEESAEAAKIREERLAAYAAKKSKKPALIAKSNIIFDVKPWDDETDMKEMEKKVRTIESEGLLWGASKLVPLAYGIKKLQISCVVEDDKVSIDWLTEQIEAFEDFVQSVDIAAFNKI